MTCPTALRKAKEGRICFGSQLKSSPLCHKGLWWPTASFHLQPGSREMNAPLNALSPFYAVWGPSPCDDAMVGDYVHTVWICVAVTLFQTLPREGKIVLENSCFTEKSVRYIKLVGWRWMTQSECPGIQLSLWFLKFWKLLSLHFSSFR